MSVLAVIAIAVPAAALVWGLSWLATGAGSLAWWIEEWRRR